MNNLGYRFMLGAAALGAIVFPFGLSSAQVALANTGQSPVCLTKTPQDVRPLTVMVASGSVDELRSKGFSSEGCAGKEADISEYRNQICSMASRMPQAGQQQFYRSYGVSLGRLCELAGEL